jgi:hypothetical protein
MIEEAEHERAFRKPPRRPVRPGMEEWRFIGIGVFVGVIFLEEMNCAAQLNGFTALPVGPGAGLSADDARFLAGALAAVLLLGTAFLLVAGLAGGNDWTAGVARGTGLLFGAYGLVESLAGLGADAGANGVLTFGLAHLLLADLACWLWFKMRETGNGKRDA